MFWEMKCSELLRLLRNDGWEEIRQSGSHIIMRHPVKIGQVVVPNHGSREVKKGLLMGILKQVNIKTDKR